jgi:hypothetical protein
VTQNDVSKVQWISVVDTQQNSVQTFATNHQSKDTLIPGFFILLPYRKMLSTTVPMFSFHE